MSSIETPEAASDEAAAPERDAAREELLAAITGELGESVVGSHIRPGDDLWIRVERGAWRDAAEFLRTGLGFAYLNFVSALDWMPSPFGRDMDSQVDLALEDPLAGSDPAGNAPEPAEPVARETGYAGGDTRFQVFARVNDVVGLRAVTLKADVPDDDPRIDSWVPVYAGADWHEREAWEMYGIAFDGHPGLRHLYLPGAFEGNPMRKDYPLLARRVKPWPGIVDVELMPGDDEGDESAEGDES